MSFGSDPYLDDSTVADLFAFLLESLEGEREDVEAALADVETVSESRLAELDHELQQLRDDKQALESEISTVQRVISFNEEMLEGTSADIMSALRMDGGSQSAESVTDQLLEGQGGHLLDVWLVGREEEHRVDDRAPPVSAPGETRQTRRDRR